MCNCNFVRVILKLLHEWPNTDDEIYFNAESYDTADDGDDGEIMVNNGYDDVGDFQNYGDDSEPKPRHHKTMTTLQTLCRLIVIICNVFVYLSSTMDQGRSYSNIKYTKCKLNSQADIHIWKVKDYKQRRRKKHLHRDRSSIKSPTTSLITNHTNNHQAEKIASPMPPSCKLKPLNINKLWKGWGLCDCNSSINLLCWCTQTAKIKYESYQMQHTNDDGPRLEGHTGTTFVHSRYHCGRRKINKNEQKD